jgi:hypothetical protein
MRASLVLPPDSDARRASGRVAVETSRGGAWLCSLSAHSEREPLREPRALRREIGVFALRRVDRA